VARFDRTSLLEGERKRTIIRRGEEERGHRVFAKQKRLKESAQGDFGRSVFKELSLGYERAYSKRKGGGGMARV